jgi:hypothetical protein
MFSELRLASHGRQLSRVIAVADLSAVARSAKADVAQLAERVLGKDEVTGSIPVIGSSLRSLPSFGWQASRLDRLFGCQTQPVG